MQKFCLLLALVALHGFSLRDSWADGARLQLSTSTLGQTGIETKPSGDASASASPPSTAASLTPTQTTEILALKPVESDEDLWNRVRRGFQMKDIDSDLVRGQERWYAARPDLISRFVERGSKYLYHIVEEVERRGLPTEIVLLPIIESAFNPQAYSRAHASGMWQFIPSTGKNYGLEQNWLNDNRRDVILSTTAALDYLTMLYGMFNSWELAFAAYNCGEGCVGRAIAYNQKRGKPTNFSSLRLPKETRTYVPRLMAVRNIVYAPESFGISLAPVSNKPYFVKVPAPAQIDVKLAARLAEMEDAEFAALNPSFNKPVAASATGSFLVPIEKERAFKENLEIYRSLNGPMVSWQMAEAKSGESVDAVAKRYGMTSSYLRATSGPFKERKGKFAKPATFLVPSKDSQEAIAAALKQKVELRETGRLPQLAMEQTASTAAAMPAEPTTRAIVAATPSAEDIQATAPLAAAPLPTPVNEAVVLPRALPLAQPALTQTTTHRVKSGDTLFGIAKQYDMDVDELKRINKLNGSLLRVGQVIRVDGPEFSTQTATKSSAPSAPRVYTIRPGDTLFGIANKFSMSLDRLLAVNRLNAQSVIQPGAKLRLSN